MPDPVKPEAPKAEPAKPAPVPAKPAAPAPPARYKVLKPCARGLEPGRIVERAEFAPKALVYQGDGKPGAPLPAEEIEAATDAAIERLLTLGVIQPAE